jgi:hypothetical protein
MLRWPFQIDLWPAVTDYSHACMHACMETETDFYVALFLAVYVESLTNYHIVA